MTQRKVLGEETVCPGCSDALRMNIDIGGGFLYDICGGCGFKRKKTLDDRVVEEVGNKIDSEWEDG